MGVGDKISKTFRLAARQTGNMIEISKLKMSISSNKEKINTMKKDIGDYIYNLYRDGKPIEQELSEICDLILDKEKEIEELDNKILEVRNVKKCYNCSNEVNIDSVFCPKCGSKISKL